MHALVALALALCTPALGSPTPGVRIGYEREIESSRYNQVPKTFDYILNEDILSSQKNRAKLVTKLRPEDAIADDNVILESNVVKILKPIARRRTAEEAVDAGLVRKRRGYNLENVRVPSRYPYLPVARFNRFRRWGY